MSVGAPGWSDAVDAVLAGDLAVAMAHTTPAGGVVVTPITNFALRDRDAATVTVLSSLGAWRKLRRLQEAPAVALAFHTRQHGYSDRLEYVLIQGYASFSTRPDHEWLASIEPQWQRFMGSRHIGPLWDWWMRVYHWERVAITIAVHRVTTWPDLACRGHPDDTDAVATPAPQKEPARGVSSRIHHHRIARAAARLPHALLGWIGADRFPTVVPVTITRSSHDGIELDVPSHLVPHGGRRAGLTAHWFSAGVLGQTQHVLTGWLTTTDDASTDSPTSNTTAVTYAPHTHRSHHLPPSKLLYRVLVGGFTRLGHRQARRAGFIAQTE